MADHSSVNIPWAGLAVVVALVSGSLLAPKAFDQLRPPEKERAQSQPGGHLEIDARLWEDPFLAMRRHVSERSDTCGRALVQHSGERGECAQGNSLDNRKPARFFENWTRAKDGKAEDHLVILALVSGSPFVGAEEARRRTRYAMLAGLQSRGYLPENTERIDLLEFQQITNTGPFRGIASNSVLVPYELLSSRPVLRGESTSNDSRYEKIALLWIDEAALPARGFDALAQMLYTLYGPSQSGKRPRLVVIGPSSSDALRNALRNLSSTAEVLMDQGSICDPFAARTLYASVGAERQRDQYTDCTLRRGYEYLSEADFLNASATAADNQIAELDGQKLQNFLNRRFAEIRAGGAPVDVEYHPMLASDNTVLRSLIRELLLRMPDRKQHRIVAIAERDSLYAHALVGEMNHQIERDKSKRERLELSPDDVNFYFRGLDGVTTRESNTRFDEPRERDEGSARSAKTIEWPETRNQLDYLRRMATEIKRSEALGRKGPISAIGIFGSDVHDKLLVLQAFRDIFPDKIFFTTDMDSRYLHPRTVGFTRNLVVASSLPLGILHSGPAANDGALTEQFAAVGLQAGTPPFRDMYQMATYLAARRAACREKSCKEQEDQATAAIRSNPSVYEIGRNGAVPVAGYAFEAEPTGSPAPRALIAAVGFPLLAALLVFWPSTPALQTARSALWRQPKQAANGAPDLPSVLMATLQIALLAYVLGSLVEFIAPGHLRFSPVLVLTVLAGFLTILALYPKPLHALTGSNACTVAPRPRPLFGRLLICLLIAALAWMVWRAYAFASCDYCEPVEWLEGVSAWPSHLLHLLALFAIAFGLDYSASKISVVFRESAEWLTDPRRSALVRPLSFDRMKWRYVSYAGWGMRRHDHVDFRSLLWQYLLRGQKGPRVVRALVGLVAMLVLAASLFLMFNQGQLPAVPARGSEHRALFGWTLVFCVILLTALIVVVADATMLTCRFIHCLNRARTSYPRELVGSFSRSLGGEQQELWTERIAADPSQRSPAAAEKLLRHTLLDDWIDVQVVARLTSPIAPLVIWPAVVVALLVVARSRLFDNWALSLPIAAAGAAYLLWLIVLAALLKNFAEQTRRCAIDRMEADLRWLNGSPRHAVLREQFESLIASVRKDSNGAFAGFFEQPLFRALLVPLGGAGGAQLIDYFLLAR